MFRLLHPRLGLARIDGPKLNKFLQCCKLLRLWFYELNIEQSSVVHWDLIALGIRLTSEWVSTRCISFYVIATSILTLIQWLCTQPINTVGLHIYSCESDSWWSVTVQLIRSCMDRLPNVGWRTRTSRWDRSNFLTATPQFRWQPFQWNYW